MDRIAMKYKLTADYTERQIALLEREAVAIQKVIDTENKRLNRDKEGFSLNTAGQRVNVDVPTKASIYEKGKSQGLTEEQAKKLANDTALPYNGISPHVPNAFGDSGENWGTRLQSEIDKLKLQSAGGNTSTTVNINMGGRSTAVRVASGEDAKALTSLLRQLESASGVAAR